MSLHGAGLDHRLWLLAAVLTHAAVGFALASVLADRSPAWGALGGVLPDVDLLFDPSWGFPFVHRGLTHAPAFAVVVGVALAVVPAGWPWRAIALGVLSHVVVDAFTATGVPLLYPLSSTTVGVDADVHGLQGHVVLWVLVLAVLVVDRRRD